jgi:hypothetical protein
MINDHRPSSSQISGLFMAIFSLNAFKTPSCKDNAIKQRLFQPVVVAAQ